MPRILIEPTLPNVITSPRLGICSIPSDAVYTIEEAPDENGSVNQSNTYYHQITRTSSKKYNNTRSTIPDRWSNSTFKPIPLAMTETTCYPPTKINEISPFQALFANAGIDSFTHECCTLWIVLAFAYLIFDIIVLLVVALSYDSLECCGIGLKTAIIGITIAMLIYLNITMVGFATVHGGQLDPPSYGECKELVLKAIHIIILIVFLSLVFWTRSNHITPEECLNTRIQKTPCSITLNYFISTWIYAHVFVICIRIISVILMPQTKAAQLNEQGLNNDSTDPDMQHVIDTLRSQRRVMDYPSVTRSIVRTQLSSEDRNRKGG